MTASRRRVLAELERYRIERERQKRQQLVEKLRSLPAAELEALGITLADLE